MGFLFHVHSVEHAPVGIHAHECIMGGTKGDEVGGCRAVDVHGEC
jgi:hypothetical protein